MINVVRVLYVGVTVAVAAAVALAVVFGVGSLPEVSDISMRKGTNSAGIFFDLHNRGFLRDCVVGVEVLGEGHTGEEVLQAELHRTVMEDNVMKMVKVDKVCVEPFSTVKMRGAEGEGYHVMVFGEVEHFDSFHVHLKMESGKVIHFYAQPAGAGSQHTH